MKAIGGYFELELQKHKHFHHNAVKLNSARNCLELILIQRKWKKIHIPYYTCEAILQPLERQNVRYVFYSIDKYLDPSSLPTLKKDEAFLYTNYFGLKQATVEKLANRYREQCIIDNAQAFFAPRLKGIDTFYSPRKFFGVPDGGYLYSDLECTISIGQAVSWDRMDHLCKRIDLSADEGYVDFQNAESSLNNAPIKRMSNLTDALLSSIDYDGVVLKRRSNFSMLDNVLGKTDLLHFALDDTAVPMTYPFFSNKTDLREQLISNRIYTAKYWKNVHQWCRNQFENELTERVIPLPVDQRYSISDLERVISSILL